MRTMLCPPHHRADPRTAAYFGRRRRPGLARSGAQTVRFGVASASHLSDQVTDKKADIARSAERGTSLYVVGRGPYAPLTRLPGSGRPQHEPASCQWICQWETWEIWDAGAGRRDVLEISAGREACEAELISRTVQVRVSERT